jgi:hypothetical protein
MMLLAYLEMLFWIAVGVAAISIGAAFIERLLK